MSLSRFITKKEIATVGHHIKLTRCPHCGATGMLILHDYLYGYDETRSIRCIKARRVFCSNRNSRTGCGKTITYRLIDFLPHSLISSRTAWQFLHGICSGMSIEHAFETLDPACVLSISTFFRFWERFKSGMHTIRTFIANNFPLPPVSEPTPARETIRHMSIHLNNPDSDPIAYYQKIAQSPFI